MKFFPRDTFQSFPSHANIILGLPSFGNVGQLSLDCVIATLFDDNQLEHLGYIESEFILPMIGFDRYPQTSQNYLCHSIEVFKMKSATPIIFIIMRSTCVEDEEQLFTGEFYDWLSAQMLRSLIVLTGADVNDNYIQDFDLHQDKPFTIFSVEAKELIIEQYPELNEIISYSINIPIIKEEPGEVVNSSEVFHYFGGMEMASYLLRSASASSQLNCLLLGRVSSSAYHLQNSLDLATMIFKYINKLSIESSFQQIQQKLRFPHSWSIVFN